jgi:DNA replicative helicase MCM subunit Mcm2 (Cdc46/Mcm family)
MNEMQGGMSKMETYKVVHICDNCGKTMQVQFMKNQVSQFRDCPKCQTLQHIIPQRRGANEKNT